MKAETAITVTQQDKLEGGGGAASLRECSG